MQILLIPSKNNYPSPFPDTTSFGQAMPYLASALKKNGHDVFGLNLNHRFCHGSAPLTLELSIRDAVNTYKPQMIGLGGLAPDYLFIRDSIQFIRRISPDTIIVLGGGIVTYDAQFIFNQLKPDFGIKGEGESALTHLVKAIEQHEDLRCVPGLVYKDNGRIVSTEEVIQDELDQIPFPDYNLFDFESYLDKNNQVNNFLGHTREHPRILPLSTGRSCPYRCTFCCHKYAAPFRLRSIDNIMDEISVFYEKYAFNILYIHDELLSASPERPLEFFNRIKKYKRETNADFDIGCYLRVNDANEQLLSVMKDARVAYIGYGLESGSDTVLKSMKKGSTAHSIKRAISLTEEAGIGFHGNFIFGDFSETPETIKETKALYEKYCKSHTVYFYYITPYPGSEIFERCRENELIKDKEEYYKTIAFQKGSVNMTGMNDDEFYGLTLPIMNETYNGFDAEILSVEKDKNETCDTDFPFEIRRQFYSIKLVCPHCREKVRHIYPLRFDQGSDISFDHSCPHCHKRYLIDLAPWAETYSDPEDELEKQLLEQPYSQYYPFNANKMAISSVPTPVLQESYNSFNMIKYGRVYYAFAQAIGPCDITRLSQQDIKEYCNQQLCFIADTISEAKKKVDDSLMLKTTCLLDAN